MADYKRSNRVSELLRQEISRIISRELKDPQIGMATVSKVKLTDDLRYARVYISIVGDVEAGQNTLVGLNRARKFVRAELGRHTNLRFVPEIEFVHDTSVQYAQDIESLIRKIHEEDD